MKPREESKRELGEKWLAKAREDLGLAEHLLAVELAAKVRDEISKGMKLLR